MSIIRRAVATGGGSGKIGDAPDLDKTGAQVGGVVAAAAVSGGQVTSWKVAPRTGATYDLRDFVGGGETLLRDGSGPGNNTAILQRAVDTLTALGTPAEIYVPTGRYVLAQAGTNTGVPYAVAWKTRVGLRGESEAGTVFLSDAGSTPLFGAYGPQLVDCQFSHFTVDCAAQTNGSYTTQLKGMFMQDMLRPRWSRVTIRNAWATGLGCDYLVDYLIEQVTTTGNGRGIAATGSDPLLTSGGSGVGIGTGKYQSEPGVITGLLSKNNGRGGLFYETQTSVTYHSRGHRAVGVVLVGNAFGLQDCGCDGLDADITATDNTYAGVILDGTLLEPKAGFNGRISGRIDRNGTSSAAGSGNIVLGAMTDGNYRIAGSAKSSPNYGVVSKSGATLGPGITIDVNADSNGAAGIYIQATPGPVRALTVAGSARNNGQNGSATRREGVALAAATVWPVITAKCVDDQASPTQTHGLRLLGPDKSMTRGYLGADVRGNATAAYVTEQTVSNDSIVALIGADTSGPSGLTATPGSSQVVLSWTAPTPSADVTDYAIQYRTSGPGSWTTFSHTASTATTATVTGLTNGTAYDFQVAAIRTGVTGPYTAGPTQATPIAAPVYADSFTRADASSLGTAGEGTSSAAWSVLTADTGAWGIASNQAAVKAGTGNSVAYLETSATSGTAEAKFPNVNATPSTRVGALAFRVQDLSNFLMVTTRGSGTGQNWVLQKKVNGTNTIIANLGVTIANNDVVKVSYTGSTIKVWINGALIGTYTDAALNTATKVGLFGNFGSDSVTRADDFKWYSDVA